MVPLQMELVATEQDVQTHDRNPLETKSEGERIETTMAYSWSSTTSGFAAEDKETQEILQTGYTTEREATTGATSPAKKMPRRGQRGEDQFEPEPSSSYAFL